MTKTSIDEQELSKFNKTADQWWDLNGEFKILHQINPIRINYILEKIKSHFKITDDYYENLRLLDVGCGGGLASVSLSKYGFKVAGSDAGEYNIKAAKSYAKKNRLNINYIHSTVEDHINSGEKYDIIVCLEVIEHVSNVGDFLINLHDMLNDGGMLIISTINRTVKSYLSIIVAAEYLLGWVPRNTHNFSKFVKPSEIVNSLHKTDLNLKEIKGLKLDIVDNKWKLTDHIDINYFITFIKT